MTEAQSITALQEIHAGLSLLLGEAPEHTDPDSSEQPQPASIREFVTSPDYLGLDWFWPKALDDLAALKAPGMLGGVIEMGIGGGKSYTVSGIPLYDIYCLEWKATTLGVDLREQYQLDPRSPVYAAIIAATGKIAKEVGRYMRMFAEECPWFQRNLPFDPNVTSELQFKRPGDDQPRYIAYAGHSKVTSVISRNLYSYVLDEANFFEKAESAGSSGKDYAEELDQQLGARVDSRFGPSGSRVTISSRYTVNDFTHRKKREIRNDPNAEGKYFLPEPRTSWHNWPRERSEKDLWRLFDKEKLRWADDRRLLFDEVEHLDGLWVPERFWSEFETNPEGALRNLASIPSDSLEPFFRRQDRIRPDFDMGSPILPGVQPEAWMEDGVSFDDLVDADFWGDPEERYHFHCDLALKHDRCGLVLARSSGVDEVALAAGETRAEKTALIDVEAVICIGAPKGGEIEFAQVRRILYWLRDDRGFKIRMSSFDGWQSVDSIQILERKGFPVETLSMDRTIEHYQTLKDGVYEGRIFFPPAHGQTPDTTSPQLSDMADAGDPCAILQREIRQLEFIKGKKIDHPPQGSKDLADALCGAVVQATRYMRQGRDV